MNIHPGEVFTAGPHKFSCCDIEKVKLKQVLDIPDDIYLTYSDPPWSGGNARYWRTFSKLDGNVGKSVDWNQFLSAFCKQVMSANPTHVFIEQGIKNIDDTIFYMLENGLPKIKGKWDVFYNTKHPNVLLYFSKIGGFTGNQDGMKNEPMTRHVFEHIAKVGEIVFDPCVGLGMTARMAHEFNMVCYGNELNPKRLEKTLSWFEKKGYQVEKING